MNHIYIHSQCYSFKINVIKLYRFFILVWSLTVCILLFASPSVRVVKDILKKPAAAVADNLLL